MAKIISKAVKELMDEVSKINIYKPYIHDARYLVKISYTRRYYSDTPVWEQRTDWVKNDPDAPALECWCPYAEDICKNICGIANWRDAYNNDAECILPDSLEYENGEWISIPGNVCWVKKHAEYWDEIPEDRVFHDIEEALKSNNRVELVSVHNRREYIEATLTIRKRSIVVQED